MACADALRGARIQDRAEELREGEGGFVAAIFIVFRVRVKMMEPEDRIILDPDIIAGKPILRGTRISVEHLLELLANGWTYEEISENYPQIGREDVLTALKYAANLLKEEQVYPISQKVMA